VTFCKRWFQKSRVSFLDLGKFKSRSRNVNVSSRLGLEDFGRYSSSVTFPFLYRYVSALQKLMNLDISGAAGISNGCFFINNTQFVKLVYQVE